MENQAFLKEQILTYLGNKRSLLGFIESGLKIVKSELKKDKLSCCDLFSGSGIVARFLKAHSDFLVVNDLELYSRITNECYLANAHENLTAEILKWSEILKYKIQNEPKNGFIAELYAPKNEFEIKPDERAFYTPKNAKFIDTARQHILDIPLHLQPFFIAPLLYGASVHANTSGIFKGFYKNKSGIGQFGGSARNALARITSDIKLLMPVFSNFSCDFRVEQMDANTLAKDLDCIDMIYLDPPYNQHPYSSNYFMLNLISHYKRPEQISKISGIAKGWNKSVYNQKSNAALAFFDLVASLRAKFIIISFNSEGFISQDEFSKNLGKMGNVIQLEKKYNTFRGSRNLRSRSTHVKELLFVLKKS